MSLDIKKRLNIDTINLMDKLDELKLTGIPSELLSLLERILCIGNISILYLDALSSKELESASSVVELGEKLANHPETFTSDKLENISNITSSIETLYREKRLLLDGQKEKSIA